MFNIVACQEQHLLQLVNEPSNFSLKKWSEGGYIPFLISKSEAFTVLVNGEVMLCGGVVPHWKGRGSLWSVLSHKIKKYPNATYRGLRQALFDQPYDRIEMDVPIDLGIAHRRAVFLGFRLECARARKYSPEGEDRALYAWVRE